MSDRPRRVRRWIARHRRLASAVLVGAAVAVAVQAMSPPAPQTRPLLVAAHDLPAGTRLGESELDTRQVPTDVTPDGAVDLRGALGRTLAAPVRRGEPLTDARLVGPGLLTGQPRGMVAATLQLADPATLRLLRSGARVDVVAGAGEVTLGGPGAGASGAVLAAGATVLAVHQTSDGGLLSAAEGGGTVVLAVTASEGRAIAAAAGQPGIGVVLLPVG